MPSSRLPQAFLRLFLPVALLVATGIGLYGQSELAHDLTRLRSQERLNVGLGAGSLSRDVRGIARDLDFLLNHSAVRTAIDAPTRHNLAHMGEDFVIFSRSRNIYDQLRWIDETGMERVRVDYFGGQPQVLPTERLQDKKQRYFFADAFRLGRGEVFISPLDLNIEQGRIEVPHKPTIRVATPIFDSRGNKRGIIILNYFGREMLDAFATAAASIANHIMVVNADGYWLRSPRQDDEWGFMFKRADLTLEARAPAAWTRIRRDDEGQARMADGLWTWQTVYPLLAGQRSSTGAVDALAPSRAGVDLRQYQWKVVAHVSVDVLNAASEAVWSKLALLAALLLGLFGLGSWKLARSWTAQVGAEAEVRRINVGLEDMVTKLSAANDRLTEAQNHLLQSEKLASIGLLAAGVAHEINNPIGFVNSNLGTLRTHIDELMKIIDAYEAVEAAHVHSPDDFATVAALKTRYDLDYLRDDVLALLAESRDGLDRVKRIIQALKDFSRIETQDEWREDDIHQGIESTLNVVWNELKYTCEVRKEYGEIPPVECVLSHLNQVFMNLLVNAAHSIEKHGVVTIRTGRAGDEIWVEIADTGKGIAPEHLSHIFDPFFTTKPVGKGTGLGLSVSYGIVKKHHGRIEVASEVGRGTVFRVWLPIRQPPAAALDEQGSPASGTNSP